VRITNSMYYKNLSANNNQVSTKLFDVNKQIASGQKIRYAFEDSDTFVKTMRLDDEITTLTQVQKSTESGLKFSTNTDTTLNEFTDTLTSFKTKLIQAANSTNGPVSLEALAQDLESMRNYLVTLSNTSINGQYLFAGTATDAIPVNSDGTYNGNDGDMSAVLGSGILQKYNISGAELLYGEESRIARKISSNVPKQHQGLLYGDVMGYPEDRVANTGYITETDTIRDMVGDNDMDATNQSDTVFYMQGTRSDGSGFKVKFSMTATQSVGELLKNIADAYKVSPSDPDTVTVTLNDAGQIEVTDKLSGSSKLDFHLVAATDFTGGTAADVTNIGLLDSGTTDLGNIINGSNSLLVTEFMHSGFTVAVASGTIEGLRSDKTYFTTENGALVSNVSQIAKGDNRYATPETRLVDVATGTTMIGTSLVLKGIENDGVTPYNVTIDFLATGVEVNGTSAFTVYGTGGNPKAPIDASNPQEPVAPDEMTYRQLMDVINIVVSGNAPAADNPAATGGIAVNYNAAVEAANQRGEVALDYRGRLTYRSGDSGTMAATLALYDAMSHDFSAGTPGSSLVFNANNAITIRDAKTDFFASLDAAIAAVRDGRLYADGGEATDKRNGGIENAIQALDDVMDHIAGVHTKAGSQSLALQYATERTETLILSSTTLRSEVLDTDIAEATLRLQQLSLNMQAMMSAISKVSQLSLVNYL